MAENTNTTVEMGTSDQVLVATKKKKRTVYIIGFLVMLLVLGLIITAVVLLSRNEGGDSDELINTTEGPTTIPPATEPTSTLPPGVPTEPPTETPTEPPVTEPALPPIDLEELNSGAFVPNTFNADWVSGNEFMYVDDDANLVLYNAVTNSTEVLVSNTSSAMQRSTRSVKRSADASAVVVAYDSQSTYRFSTLTRYTGVNLGTGAEIEIGPVGVEEPVLQNLVWGPTGTAMAFVYLNNIYYKANLTTDAQQISTNGVVDVIYNGIPDWVYEEEVFGSTEALWFSSDGAHLMYATFDDSSVRVMPVPHYGVPGSIEHQYTSHHPVRYPKAGTTNPTVSVTIVNLVANTTTTIQEPASLYEPILLSASFATETSAALVWSNRVQNQIEVHLCTLGQVTCDVIFTHSQPTGWIDNNPVIFNQAGNSFVTILPHTVDGVLWKQVIQVSAGSAAAAAWTLQDRSNTTHSVLDILAWTDDDVVWYKATHPLDSAQTHLYRLAASAAPECFTCDLQHTNGQSCLFNEAKLSADRSLATVTCAGPAVPQVFLYNTTTKERLSVWQDNAGISALVEERSVPQITRLSVPVQEGLPEAQVLIQHPPDVQNLSNVPLLVSVYAGPNSASVTHAWSVDWGSTLVSRWGIAVAQIDGRGSGRKQVDNLFALNRRLGTVEVEDQIAVTKYLQQNLGYVDANRTCIWGWSYGGYASTLALVRGGDVFRCAVAVAPVTDWRYYDTIYTERYMDVPANNSEGYTRASLLNAETTAVLRDKRYFVVHGTADDNVHYQQSMMLSRMLQLRDVYFHQMSYTDEDHGFDNVRPHFYHAIEHFLEENML